MAPFFNFLSEYVGEFVWVVMAGANARPGEENLIFLLVKIHRKFGVLGVLDLSGLELGQA